MNSAFSLLQCLLNAQNHASRASTFHPGINISPFPAARGNFGSMMNSKLMKDFQKCSRFSQAVFNLEIPPPSVDGFSRNFQWCNQKIREAKSKRNIYFPAMSLSWLYTMRLYISYILCVIAEEKGKRRVERVIIFIAKFFFIPSLFRRQTRLLWE